jgi:hypothetical protein
MSQNSFRQYFFVVALTNVQAAERPEMAEVESGEDASVAKVAISQYLRKEPINEDIQLDCGHSTIPLLVRVGIIAHKLLIFGMVR